MWFCKKRAVNNVIVKNLKRSLIVVMSFCVVATFSQYYTLAKEIYPEINQTDIADFNVKECELSEQNVTGASGGTVINGNDLVAALGDQDNATVKGSVVTLKKDVNLSKTVVLNLSGSDAVLNLNGKTISSSWKTTCFEVNSGNFTVQGNGTVVAGRYRNCIVVNGGTFNLKGGNVKCSETWWDSGDENNGILVKDGNVNILGGTVTGGSSRGATYAYASSGLKIDGGTVNVSGGTIKGGNASSSVKSLAGKAVIITKGTFNVCGGTFTGGSASAASAAYSIGLKIESKEANVSLSGGTFEGGNCKTAITCDSVTFSSVQKLSDCVADGYKIYVTHDNVKKEICGDLLSVRDKITIEK